MGRVGGGGALTVCSITDITLVEIRVAMTTIHDRRTALVLRPLSPPLYSPQSLQLWIICRSIPVIFIPFLLSRCFHRTLCYYWVLRAPTEVSVLHADLIVLSAEINHISLVAAYFSQ